ncbi:MAG: hypothetical protein WAM07_06350, partial [Halobacillus sp.]|uniref:hypothetical protein n=1 Tax=Halobacillus sp. TaxID=56800 RepID=UPI003BAE949E
TNGDIEAFKIGFPARVRSHEMAGAAEETTRLPREKELGETPQGVLTTEEACQFPAGKRVVSVAALIYCLQRTPNYLETESSTKGSLTLITTRTLTEVIS